MRTVALVRRILAPLMLVLAGAACGESTSERAPAEGGGEEFPACPGGPIFSVSPVPLDAITSIVGMGWFTAPGHVVPSDHGGMFVKAEGVELRAPGAITIVALRRVTYAVSPNRQGVKDYAITYHACGREMGTFGHVASLTPDLEGRIGGAQCTTYSTAEETVETCTENVHIDVAAGDLLGAVGGASAEVVDWGHMDEARAHPFVNPSRFAPAVLHATCPYDRFEPPLRDLLVAKMQRTLEPRCGSMDIDVRDTAQGVWVDASNAVSQAGDERPFITLGPHYEDETKLRLALGPEALGGRERDVPREPAGRKNRSFADVGPDGVIYCYVESTMSTESHLLGLDASGELRVELRAHAAGASPCDTDPSTWAFTPAAMTFIR